MFLLPPLYWQQKGGGRYGILRHSFVGGRGAGSWTLRVQVVRPS